MPYVQLSLLSYKFMALKIMPEVVSAPIKMGWKLGKKLVANDYERCPMLEGNIVDIDVMHKALYMTMYTENNC